jgi:hypothetical protein
MNRPLNTSTDPRDDPPDDPDSKQEHPTRMPAPEARRSEPAEKGPGSASADVGMTADGEASSRGAG